MINISIDPARLFAFIALIALAYAIISSIKYTTLASKRDKLVKEWLQDKEKIELYNLYIKYVETDITTGLRKSQHNIEFPVINSEEDYLKLCNSDKILVQVVIMYIARNYTDYHELKNHIEKYLESAEIIRQSRGF